MAEARCVVRSKAASSTGDSSSNIDNVPCDTEELCESSISGPPVTSPSVRSSSNILTRIKTITFGRLRKPCHPSTPKSVSPITVESAATSADLQSSTDSMVMVRQQTDEKPSFFARNGRRRRILSHLCTSASRETDGESSIVSLESNTPLDTSERSSPSSSSSATSPVSRPSDPSNQLISDQVHETSQSKGHTQSSRPIHSSTSNEPNNMNRHHHNVSQSVSSASVMRSPEVTASTRRPIDESVLPYPYLNRLNEAAASPHLMSLVPTAPSITLPNRALPNRIHTQIDFIHCFVPDFLEITNFPFYWCKMDRYEAEKLLEKKPDGTFLLRDSAQEDHLFSISFRRFQQSVHARIEQSNDRVSFNTLDPGVYSCATVRQLIEHYRDQKNWTFFEPMLILPLHRTFPFSLKHLSRAKICSLTTFDSVSHLPLPKPLKNYLQEYHYKKKVAERRFESTAS